MNQLGATCLEDNRCRFRVWAPLHDRVEVRIVGPAERIEAMHRDEAGFHEATLDDVPAGSRYVYRLTNGLERPDPASKLQPDGVHGPSQVVPLDFAWSDHEWRGVPLRDLVIYELHVGTFTPEGTFDAVIPRLVELAELGVTALELLPIAQFPGSRNWGYDGVHPFAAQESYGGPAGLHRLVDACHRLGLAVILDVVYNHLGPEGNYLAAFAPYFSTRVHTEWGPTPNFDAPHSDPVRDFFLQNAMYWLRDLHIDGLRLDAVNSIHDNTATHWLEELSRAVDAAFPPGTPRKLLFAESLSNDPRMIRSREQHGHGLHAQWCDDFHHALHAALTGEHGGYYQDYGPLEHLAKTYRMGYRWTGEFCAYRQRRHGRQPVGVRAEQIVVYAQNHDQVGNRRSGERLSLLLPFEALKLAAAALLVSPNVPMLFMGEEYGETAPFPFFTSHGDQDLIDAVRKGRQREFAAFDWQGEPPDPQSEEVYLLAKLNWSLRETGRHRVLWEMHRELLRLRREHSVLTRRDFADVTTTVDEASRWLVLRRRHAGREVAIAMNFSTAEIASPLPPGDVIFDSERWAGASRFAEGVLRPWQAVAVEVE